MIRHAPVFHRSHRASWRISGPARPFLTGLGTRGATIALVAIAMMALSACGNLSVPDDLNPFGSATPKGVARLVPKNGSAASGLFSFVQSGDGVAVSAVVFDLAPGPHSIHIHAVGNCSSPNGASAGAVWNVPGDNGGRKRTGDMPEIFMRESGMAQSSFRLRGLTVATGQPNDVIGHAIVVQDGVVDDPQPVFGVSNGWVACGVIERQRASVSE